MAVRFDAASDRLVRTSSLPNYNSTYTIMGWVLVPSNPTDYGAVFALDADANNNDVLWLDGGYSANTEFRFCLYTTVGGTFAETVPGTNRALNTWFHVAMVRSSVTQLLLYVNGSLQTTHTNGTVASRTAIAELGVGGFGTGTTDPANIRVAYLKCWTTNLSADQIVAEQYAVRPLEMGSLHAWWPTFPGSAVRAEDRSGNGRAFTENGTLTDEQEPPVSFGSLPWIAPWAAAAGGTTYNQSVSGGLTPAGAMARQISALKAGSMSSSGALARRPATAKTGSVTPAGSLTKQTRLSKAGGITPSGALSAIKTALVALSGAVAFAGALVRQIATAKTGSLTSSGALTRQTRLSKTGAVTPSGALSAIRAALLSLAGSLASSGALVRQTRPLKAGTLTSAGGLNKLVSTAKAGSLTPSGTLTKVRAVLLSLAGSLTSSGALLRQTGKSLSGSLASGGSLTRLIGKILSGALSLAGALAAQGGTLIYKALHARLRDYTLTASERDHDLTAGDRDYTLTAEDR